MHVGEPLRESLRAVVLPFLVQRTVLFLAMAIAWQGLPLAVDSLRPTPSNFLIEPWFRHDALWYLTIAGSGYEGHRLVQFFPGYPWLVRGVALVFSLPAAALLASNAAALGGFVFFHRFAVTVVDEIAARRAVLLLLLFPTSFFLSAPYSESLYFLATSMALFGWGTRRPAVAALGVFLGTVARPVGAVCLTAPFVLEWAFRSRRAADLPFFTLAVVPGALLVAGTHWFSSGDPLASIRAGMYSARDAYAALPDTNVLEVLRAQGIGLALARRLSNWAVLALALGTSVALVRSGRLALGLLTIGSVGVPLAVQGTLFDATSMGRYLLGGPPFALVLAAWCEKQREGGRALTVAFALLQAAFATGYATWVWTE